MVEFGLQLEDNKVDEWSSHYIDYVKLRGLLDRAKASAELRDELIKRMPTDVVAEVARIRKDRLAGSFSAVGEKNSYDLSGSLKDDSSPCVIDDSTPLLRKKSSIHINQTLLQVTNYLGLVDDRDVLLEAYVVVDDQLRSFEQANENELAKVNDFYQEKLNEISQRTDGLLESVDASFGQPKKYHHRRSRSLEDWITKKLGSMIHGDRLRLRKRSTIPDIERVFSESDDEDDALEKERKEVEKVKISDSIKRAIADVYRTAKLLHNFSILNYSGFSEIAKNWDRNFPEHKGRFKGKCCDEGMQLNLLASKMEQMYSTWFCNGDILAAQAQMLPKRGDGLLMDWIQLRLGYRLGMCTILVLWVAWDCVWGVVENGQVSIARRTAFPVFRGCFGLVAWHWFWGMSVYVWTRYRINYIYLFEFDPRNVDTPIGIFNEAADELLVFLICMLLYDKADAADMPMWIPPDAYPTFLILYAIKCLLFPWRRRKTLWLSIKQVISVPFVSPTFFNIYVGDVFTSMVKVFQDLLWTICFVGSGDFLLSVADHKKGYAHNWTEQFWYKNVAIPLTCLFPLWLRLIICLRRYGETGNRMPHLANVFKYSMSSVVTLFGAFHPLYLMQSGGHAHTDGQGGGVVVESSRHEGTMFQTFWFVMFISSSLYSFCWDVYIDWGLGRRDYDYLGPRLMFPKKSYYYMVICVDLVLRFMWVITLVPPQSGALFTLPVYLSAVQMVVELFRRTIWSFFRLENEHRQNTQGSRRENVVPLHFSTGHTHKYNERYFVGWKVLVEITVVTAAVVGISAYSVIVAQRTI